MLGDRRASATRIGLAGPPSRCQRRSAALQLGLILIGLAAGRPAAGLNPQRPIALYGLEIWRVEQGLPQESVFAVHTTRDGYLWVGTFEGLVRFDGRGFSVFDKRTTPAFEVNGIRALHEDRTGALWIGTLGGGAAVLRAGRIATEPHLQELRGASVLAIAETTDGALWFGTYGRGLYRLDGSDLSRLTARDQLASDFVACLEPDPEGGIWVGTFGGGLDHVTDGGVTNVDPAGDLADAHVRSLLVDRRGTLWVGTGGRGLRHLENGSLVAGDGHDELADDTVLALLEDRDGCLWIGTSRGLGRLSGTGLQMLTTESGLSDNDVLSLAEDREGGLWIGTHGGLTRLKDTPIVTYTTVHGLSNADVRVVLGDPSGGLWVGTEQGLNRLAGGRVVSFPFQDRLTSERVFALAVDRRGVLWIGTRGSGVLRLARGGLTRLTRAGGLSHDVVSCILEDRQGAIWIGTNSGLTRLSEGRISVFTMADGLSDDTVLALLEGRDGSLWIGSQAGLTRYRDGRFEVVPAAVAEDIVAALHEDDRGVLWIGTFGTGLRRLQGESLASVTSADGLHDDVVYQILEDDRGHLWMSCNDGIYRASRDELDAFAAGQIDRIRCQSFGTPDGMRSRECNGGSHPAGWRDPDGTLWFPTTRGLVAVDPAPRGPSPLVPPVHIERVMVDSLEVPPGPVVAVPAASRRLEIHYAGLSLSAPERIRYRYALKGYDPGWVEAGIDRTAHYGNLAPGTYQFIVSATVDDGVWPEDGATVMVRKLPHFYQTWWFYGLSVVVAAGAALTVHRLRVRRLTARQRELEGLVTERTLELADANATLEAQKLQLEESNRQLERLSFVDGLTGVANRRHFDQTLTDEWRRAVRARSPLAAVLVDLDDFKAFNDTYGHQAGDDCLRRVAAALSESLGRSSDLVARYGGEEFVLLLPGLDRERATALAELLRSRVEGLEIPHRGSRVRRVVTVSLGVAAVVPGPEDRPAGLLELADAALYRAKGAGRNRVEAA